MTWWRNNNKLRNKKNHLTRRSRKQQQQQQQQQQKSRFDGGGEVYEDEEQPRNAFDFGSYNKTMTQKQKNNVDKFLGYDDDDSDDDDDDDLRGQKSTADSNDHHEDEEQPRNAFDFGSYNKNMTQEQKNNVDKFRNVDDDSDDDNTEDEEQSRNNTYNFRPATTYIPTTPAPTSVPTPVLAAAVTVPTSVLVTPTVPTSHTAVEVAETVPHTETEIPAKTNLALEKREVYVQILGLIATKSKRLLQLPSSIVEVYNIFYDKKIKWSLSTVTTLKTISNYLSNIETIIRAGSGSSSSSNNTDLLKQLNDMKIPLTSMLYYTYTNCSNEDVVKIEIITALFSMYFECLHKNSIVRDFLLDCVNGITYIVEPIDKIYIALHLHVHTDDNNNNDLEKLFTLNNTLTLTTEQVQTLVTRFPNDISFKIPDDGEILNLVKKNENILKAFYGSDYPTKMDDKIQFMKKKLTDALEIKKQTIKEVNDFLIWKLKTTSASTGNKNGGSGVRPRYYSAKRGVSRTERRTRTRMRSTRRRRRNSIQRRCKRTQRRARSGEPQRRDGRKCRVYLEKKTAPHRCRGNGSGNGSGVWESVVRQIRDEKRRRPYK